MPRHRPSLYLQLIFNLAFTPIQFGLRNNLLANIPYLLWTLFATVLRITITVMNW